MLDAYMIMPNHFHGILIFRDHGRGVLQYAPTNDDRHALRSPSNSLGDVMRGFKSAVTTRINGIRNSPRVTVWQRNYYEHVIRNDDDLNAVREYIVNNPAGGDKDEENPDIVGAGFKPAPTVNRTHG